MDATIETVAQRNARLLREIAAEKEAAKPLKIKGHKFSYTHVNASSVKGYCECGWQSSCWTGKVSQVRVSHQCHLVSITRKEGLS